MRRITHVRLPQPRIQGEDENLYCITLDDASRIVEIKPLQADHLDQGEDWGGDWLSPMAIDLQINGGMGIHFPEIDHKDMPLLFKLLDHLWADGVEAICPTIITCEVSKLRKTLNIFQKAREQKYRM